MALVQTQQFASDFFGGELTTARTMRMSGILASQMKFALQIRLGDFRIAQGHTDIFVAEQLHESGKANSESEHLTGFDSLPRNRCQGVSVIV